MTKTNKTKKKKKINTQQEKRKEKGVSKFPTVRSLILILK